MQDICALGDLQKRLAIPRVAWFEHDDYGMARLSIATPQADAEIYLHGAHVAHYRPRGQSPVLFLSQESARDPARAFRGGVPICFPWFAANKANSNAPSHGFARLAEWQVHSVSQDAGGVVRAAFCLESSPATLALWPGRFAARHTVAVGGTLDMLLEVTNLGCEPFVFEEALHTYLSVADIRSTTVTGLSGAEYLDKPDAFRRKVQDGDIDFVAETDRVYVNTQARCVVTDSGNGRRIIVDKRGSNATVVWNPWQARAKAMADLGDDEWQVMLCVETANVVENAVQLAGGASHAMRASISTEML